MSVSSSTSRVQYNCNGITVAFPFTFGVQVSSEIQVILADSLGVETILTETTNYSVSAVNNDFSAGGTVTTVATYDSGYTITIIRDVPLTQESDYTEGMPTLYESFEDGLDKLTRIAQQLEEKLDRMIVVPVTESDLLSRELPSAEARAGKYLGFDADGEPVAAVNIEGVTVSTFGNALLTSDDAAEARTALEVYSETEVDDAIDAALGSVSGGLITNLKPVVNATVNKLDIHTKTGNADPDATNVIKVNIPDGNGYTERSRNGSYLSGNSQIILADGQNYWSKGSLDAEIKTAWLYAIFDTTGIVWALAGYSGWTAIPSTTTTVTDDDFFLLEDGSTYTRNTAHYCVAVAKIRYQYDTADTPDHTIQASGNNAPQVIWNPASDYGYTKTYGNTTTQASDITDADVSLVLKQSGKYYAHGQASGYCVGGSTNIPARIKVGNALLASAVQKAYQYHGETTGSVYIGSNVDAIFHANAGDTLHFAINVTGASGNRVLIGDDTNLGTTTLSFRRID